MNYKGAFRNLTENLRLFFSAFLDLLHLLRPDLWSADQSGHCTASRPPGAFLPKFMVGKLDVNPAHQIHLHEN